MLEDILGKMDFAGEIRHFILGGNATFTLRKDGKRFTYKVKSTKADRDANWSTGNQDKSKYFVSLLTGPNNEADYAYMGMLTQDVVNGDYFFHQTQKSVVKAGPGLNLFWRFWRQLEQGCKVWPGVEFWHEGHCCMCGRKLTVPSSIASGIGPECASKES